VRERARKAWESHAKVTWSMGKHSSLAVDGDSNASMIEIASIHAMGWKMQGKSHLCECKKCSHIYLLSRAEQRISM
jgi:hypothetical protein